LLHGVHLVVGPLEEEGIAKLVCAIATGIQFLVDTAKLFIVDESSFKTIEDSDIILEEILWRTFRSS
jgi:hypothetical protein